MSSRVTLGRGLITAAIVLGLVTGQALHWTIGHYADPTWPPHARYHLVLYDASMALVGLGAVWCLWGPHRDEWLAPRAAAFTVVAFFLPLFPAALFPRASVYATPKAEAAGGMPPNLVFAAFAIALAVAGYLLARGGAAHSAAGRPIPERRT